MWVLVGQWYASGEKIFCAGSPGLGQNCAKRTGRRATKILKPKVLVSEWEVFICFECLLLKLNKAIQKIYKG